MSERMVQGKQKLTRKTTATAKNPARQQTLSLSCDIQVKVEINCWQYTYTIQITYHPKSE